MRRLCNFQLGVESECISGRNFEIVLCIVILTFSGLNIKICSGNFKMLFFMIRQKNWPKKRKSPTVT